MQPQINAHIAAIFAAVVADSILGEPAFLHPLVGFGNIAVKIDACLFTDDLLKIAPIYQRAIGVVAVALTIVPLVVAAYFFAKLLPFICSAILLYLTIGWKSLSQHAKQVAQAIDRGDLSEARRRVGLIVSRNTGQMKPVDISRATIESVLENGCDAVFAALFWFLLLGPAGAVLFRLSNTLDAMWGYKTEKYLHFGWAAARLDDLLCYIPARLTALTYAVCGNARQALECWRRQAREWYSPNAGAVMSAGAGALGLSLGGPAIYHGSLKQRPLLGAGSDPTSADISRAVSLVSRGVWLWVAIAAGLMIFCSNATCLLPPG
jgi:adenosylcobinamide-phosphate synthase